MANERTAREIAGDILYQRREDVAEAAAEHLGRPTGTRAMTLREQREAFWKRFLDPEQEAALLAQGQTQLQVSAAVYKRRWELWEAQPGDLVDKLDWAKKFADLGPPETDEQPTAEPEMVATETGDVERVATEARDGRY